MNHTDEDVDAAGKSQIIGNQVYFIKDEKTLVDPNNVSDREKPQDDPDSEIDDPEIATQVDGNQSPAEIKLKAKKALLEFRCRVEDSILGNHLFGESEPKMCPEELRLVSLWGVPLLPSKAHEGTDNVLLKFLKAKDFSVTDAFEMLQKTMIWRRDNNIDGILDEQFDAEFAESIYLNGRDREGRPVCYNVYGIFKNKELYKKAFETEDTRNKFLRWRIQFMEKVIKKLSFREGGVDSFVQIIDFNNAPKHGVKELNSVSKKILSLFQAYYPEIIFRNVGILAFHMFIFIFPFVF